MNIIEETTIKELEDYIVPYESLSRYIVKFTIYDGNKKSLGTPNFTYRLFSLNKALKTDDILEFDVFWDQIEIHSRTINIEPHAKCISTLENSYSDLPDKKRMYEAITLYLKAII